MRAALLSLCLALGAWAAEPPATVAGMAPERALELGRRMYRDGILPSGEPLQALVSGDVPVRGSSFSCVTCHLRAGLGSFEGGVVTLPTNGAKLAQPLYWKFPNLTPAERAKLGLALEPVRPAYTDAALAAVITTGFDPAGRELSHAMPRYSLAGKDLEILVHYLRNLSAEPSPGVDATTLRLATVIAGPVPESDRAAMLTPLDNYVTRHNTHAGGFDTRMYMYAGGVEMSGAYRRLQVDRWILEGPPETWGRQLAEHQRKAPVFALVGGLAAGPWAPIHDFCEARGLPCLLPLTDFPAPREGDWYTLYFNRGHRQEGAATARFLRDLPAAAGTVLQVVGGDPADQELAAGFKEAFEEARPGALRTVTLGPGRDLDADGLRRLLQEQRPAALLLWIGEARAGALAALADEATRPAFVGLSWTRLRNRLGSVPEAARTAVHLAHPYRDPREEPRHARYANSLMAGLKDLRPETRIPTRTYSMLQVLTRGLAEMDRNFYRDHFLDRISMLPDLVLPDFVRLSFGPGQRHASKGCHLVRLGPGASPELRVVSPWVIH